MPTQKKIAMLWPFLLGLVILTLIITIRPAQPVAATEPTPTPAVTDGSKPHSGSSEEPCRLEQGAECEFPRRDDVASATLIGPRTNPTIGAQGVSTYTLISITFDRDMDFNTINNDTFQVSRGDSRLNGVIRYIEVSRIAVFYPDAPLEPDSAYTARVTTGIRDRSGEPLAEDIVWSFITRSHKSPLSDQLSVAENEISAADMNIYFGDLHSHTGYSDGVGTPADAFATARANGIDFFAVTDHGFLLTGAEWQDILDQANAATINGAFVALRGFEFTHAKGHLNVFDTNILVRGNDPNYANLDDFYNWLVNQPTALAQFNHPLQDQMHDWNFNNFAYRPAADQKIVLRELTNATQFFLSLDAGWHLGTLSNTDTHWPNWGCCPRMGVVAPALTKQAILDGLRAKRTFFVSPDDPNLALVMTANGYWMGSAVPNTATLNFVITAYDPAPKGQPLRLVLYNNGVRIASTTLSSANSYRWAPTTPGQLGHYYYAEAYYDGWNFPAYSSPIWVERPPMAEAGPAQTVAPGMTVTLDGSGSWDPDGDALAYKWSQTSGTGVNLIGADGARPTFIAPATLGDLQFRLTVVDTGNLTGSAETRVTVTDRPVLAIRKNAPATAEPGESIIYTLTVTNYGVNDASDVVVTDAIPTGATYVSGGTLMPGNIVSWTLPRLAANGEVAEVSFVVTADQGLANIDYGATCSDCVPAIGDEIIFTNANKYYLPIIMMRHN